MADLRYMDDLVPMTRRFKSFLSMICVAVLAAGPRRRRSPLKILALGTSLTQGYGLPPGTEFTVQLQAALKAGGHRRAWWTMPASPATPAPAGCRGWTGRWPTIPTR